MPESMRSIVLQPWEIQHLQKHGKGQLRRVVDPQPTSLPIPHPEKWTYWWREDGGAVEVESPFGAPGDTLEYLDPHDLCPTCDQNYSGALCTCMEPSGHLLVKAVRAERLRDTIPGCVDGHGGRIDEMGSCDACSLGNALIKLWAEDNPDHPWKSNPWVRVADVEVVE